MASEAGLGLAMMSVADNYKRGVGIRKNHRMSTEWLWRASQIKTANACKELDLQCVLVKEYCAVETSLEQGNLQRLSETSVSMGGPNYSRLVSQFICLLPFCQRNSSNYIAFYILHHN